MSVAAPNGRREGMNRPRNGRLDTSTILPLRHFLCVELGVIGHAARVLRGSIPIRPLRFTAGEAGAVNGDTQPLPSITDCLPIRLRHLRPFLCGQRRPQLDDCSVLWLEIPSMYKSRCRLLQGYVLGHQRHPTIRPIRRAKPFVLVVVMLGP